MFNWKTRSPWVSWREVYSLIDEVNRQYVLHWDAQKNDENIAYVVYGASREEQIGKQVTYNKYMFKDGENWKAVVNVEDALFGSQDIYFAIMASDVNDKERFEFSETLSVPMGKSATNIDWYMKNVEWKFEEIEGAKRMVLEFDFDRSSKYLNFLDEGYYVHTLIPLWEFRNGVDINFDFRQYWHVANPNTDINSGGISNEVKSFINNARIMIGYLRSNDWGHKKYVIKELRHPNINGKVSIKNEKGITLDELLVYVKSENNPAGVIDSLSDMYLVMSYGMRYEPYPGYWLSTGDYHSFTPDTDPIGSQVKYYLQVSMLQ